MIVLIFYVLLTFFFTGIPTGFILVKILRKQDIRLSGSGNIGATNVRRLLGTGWSLVVLLIDAAKGALPMLLAEHFQIGVQLFGWQITLIAVISVLGNVFSPWLGFKGGKGIATSLGVALAIVPVPLAMAAAVFFLTAVISNFISLSSIVSVCCLPICIMAYAKLTGKNFKPSVLVFGIALALIVLWTHRENISRLMRGEEHTITKSKKKR